MTAKSKKTAPRRRRGRGTLAILGGLLVASAAMRLVGGAGEAIALELTPLASAPETDDASQSHAFQMMNDADLAPVLAALKAREARLEKRETDIRKRLQALAIAEGEIDRKMDAMQKAESDLRATLALAQTAAEDDLTKLTDVYANMKPKQASALFEEMDPDFAAGFLGRMRPDSAAAIMAGLSPRAAYTISIVLAGRNAGVPKE